MFYKRKKDVCSADILLIFAANAAMISIIFLGDMCGGENTARAATVRSEGVRARAAKGGDKVPLGREAECKNSKKCLHFLEALCAFSNAEG